MATTAKKPLPLPPARVLVRAPSRATRVADLSDATAAWPDTPPRRSPVTVPFLWEDAPGKPKAPPATAAAVPPDAGATDAAATTTTLATDDAGDHDSNGGGDEKAARPVPLKLPPRLQHVASARQRDGSLSPKSVLHGPYYYGCASGKRPPPRRTASGFAAFRRKTPSAGVGLFSRSKAAAAAWTSKNKGRGHHSAAAATDAPWSSPAASSSASSSSSSSLSTGSWYRRAGDAREDGSSEEDECAGGAVRITRFRRNRSFPSMTTSHFWASIRKSVKQITPWS